MKRFMIYFTAGLALLIPTIIFAESAASPNTPGKTLTSTNQRVTVFIPQGEEWKCIEESDPKLLLTLVTCYHVLENKNFYLFAQDYEVDTDSVLPAKILAKEVFPSVYKNYYFQARVSAPQAITHQAYSGYEIQIYAAGKNLKKKKEKKPPIFRRAQIFARGNHVFEIGIEASPELVKKYQAEIDRFMKEVQLKGLTEDTDVPE